MTRALVLVWALGAVGCASAGKAPTVHMHQSPPDCAFEALTEIYIEPRAVDAHSWRFLREEASARALAVGADAIISIEWIVVPATAGGVLPSQSNTPLRGFRGTPIRYGAGCR